MNSTEAAADTLDPDTIDLADPATFADHDLSEFWRMLRDTRPVHWNQATRHRRGFWVLTRHDDIMAVYRDDTNFTSERGNVLVTLLEGGDVGAGRMLAVTDGPRHEQLRKIMLKSLGPRTLGPVAAAVRANTRHLIREAVARGDCDFALDIASRIPMTTISNLLGVPESDRDFLLAQTKAALSADDADADEVESAMARNEILLYFQDLVEQRRKAPGEDLISVLVDSVVAGEPLSDEDIVLNCYSLIIGGDETSRLSMIDSVYTLAAHPEQWRLLKNGECAIDTAVDEVLRWASPSMHFGRTAVRDTEIRGVRIGVNDIVTLWHAAANRDERVFDRPQVFDLRRTPNRQISFGYGPHYCVGSYLAKIEISELLMALRDLTTGFERIGDAPRIRSNLLTGFSSLPVRFFPDHAGLSRHDSAER
ncbi:cytochrome P450 [Streptomyces malaysiensis]|uniref:Cytochrome P450 n=1 Tax=Streptomyces malaysiensis subsp. samsunensis TaxID=459658 RepID=A0A9X2S100_STRMQ|nr:cytochrome P450 [Streptomyces samsunensis]MCQ8835980.1 cytochrome P450 [Streptomyces samsunensis]